MKGYWEWTIAPVREAQKPYEFSVTRLAKRWGRNHEFIVGEIRTGRLNARRIGGRHLRVHIDEITRYEKEHAVVEEDPSLA